MRLRPSRGRAGAAVRPLGGEDRQRVLDLLAEDPAAHIYLLSVLRRGARSGTLTAEGEFFGTPADGPLAALVYASAAGLVIPAGRDGDAVARIGAALRRRVRPVLTVGSARAASAFVEGHRSRRPRIDRFHHLYVLGRGALRERGDPAVRPARPRDVECLVRLAARMQFEELRVDPLDRDPEGFRRRIVRIVREERFYVLPRDGTHAFQASAAAYCAEGTQIEGVYTPPELRGRGFATRGLAGMCEALLAQHPLLTLTVHEENEPACRLYERLGFRICGRFRLLVY